MAIPLYVPMYIRDEGTGSFTSKIFLTIPLIVSIYLLIIKKNQGVFQFYKNEKWIYWVLLLILISICNPYNYAVLATVAFAIVFLSYILFFKLIYNYLGPADIVKGVFSSFMFLCILQFTLAILYPLLGVSFVTTIFQAGGEQWATRIGTRAGAIGVFVTPANLGLFTTIASGFFFASYLGNYQKKISLIFLFVNVITIILTYSRTSYITLVFVLFLMFFIYKNAKKPLFSFRSVLFGIVPALLVVYWIVFLSPLSAIFLKTDADQMYEARLDHWVMGMEIFKMSPIIGVGINTHVEFVNHAINLYKVVHNEFLTTNPIHNTHLIILTETGVIGFLFWVIFLVTSVVKAKQNIAVNNNVVFSLAQIGLIITLVIYGFTDWAPLSQSIFPIFLLFTFFSKKYSLRFNF
ncbi:O-antigen ligase family protein [Mucilaginibacter sp.]|uniref:O-antigen ligase family protein n=1 Tax=Mucilaginibacter sp. TaxID=1882438 RepID=UPI00261CC8DD|nr:O-antigen ligase family protein [Mucilaginibacter sp.]